MADAKKCDLLSGLFGYFVQGLLGAISLGALLYKFLRERRLLKVHARKWTTFSLDSSKQVAGAALIHGLNLVLSEKLKLNSVADACEWYWVNIMVDTTFGVGFEIGLLSLLRLALKKAPRSAHSSYISDLLNGVYTKAGSHGKLDGVNYVLQLSIWLLIVSAMKLVSYAFMQFGALWLAEFAHWVLTPVKKYNEAELIAVMIWTPIVMNSLQYWVTDNAIKHRPDDQTNGSFGNEVVETVLSSDSGENGITPASYSIALAEVDVGFAKVLFRCAVPLLLVLVGIACLLLAPLHGTCPQPDMKTDFDIFLTAIVYMVVCISVPYYLLICIGVCPNLNSDGEYEWGLPLVIWCFLGVSVPTFLVLCKLLGNAEYWVYTDTSIWNLGVSLSTLISVPVWLGYGVGFVDWGCLERTSRLTEFVPSFALRQAVENNIGLTHTQREMTDHFGWISNTSSDGEPSAMSVSMQEQVLLRPALRQWLFLGLLFLCESSLRSLLIYWTLLFLTVASKFPQGVSKIEPSTYCIFLLFVVGCQLGKTCLKAVGFMCDSGRTGSSFSGYYVAYAVGTYAYLYCYRAMFATITDSNAFVIFQTLHIAGTWLEHVLPATDWFYATLIRRVYPAWLESVLKHTSLARHPNVSRSDWQCFMAVEMALHFFCAVYTIVTFSFGYTLLFLGPNKKYVRNLSNLFNTDAFLVLMLKCAVQLITEVINASLIELWYRRRVGRMGSLKRVHIVLRSWQLFITLTVISASGGVSLWLVFLPQDFC